MASDSDDLMDEPTLSPDVDESFTGWRRADLGEPFVPARFASELSHYHEWAWGCLLHERGWSKTETATVADAYLLSPEVSRFVDGDWRQRYYLGHCGHGANSYGITYLIVTDRAAVFAQRGWGGVYMDEERAAADVRRMSAELHTLFHAIDQPVQWPEGRLVVVDSDFRAAEQHFWLSSPDSAPLPLQTANGPGLLAAADFVTSMELSGRDTWRRW